MTSRNPQIAQELLSHQAFLRRLAVDLVGEDADDLVQEVWQRALERPPHHARQLRGWLARVARNLATSRWRGEARREERDERRASERASAEELEGRLELRKVLVEALGSLSQPCRETILLRYFEGLAPRDIARRQGTPVATVKTRLRRGLAQLREALDQRYGGDRGAWMSAVAVLGAPAGSGGVTGSLVIGATAMGTMTKVSAAALVVAAGVYLVARTPEVEPTPTEPVRPPASDVELASGELGKVGLATAAADTSTEAVRRSSVTEQPAAGAAAALGANALRVILEGIAEEDARAATVTLMGLDERDGWPVEIGHSWPARGLTSELDLDPVLASVERLANLRAGELEVAVDHPQHLGERTRLSVARDAEPTNGRIVHEVRVRLVRAELWPELTLAVRDAHTRAHLEKVELRIASGPGTAFWGRNPTSRLLGDGLRSPVVLMGAREPDEETVAGVALSPAGGESLRIVELARRVSPERGVLVSARAPGYAWGSTSIDVSKGERELLLEPAAALGVRLANVQLERYAALDALPMLCLYRIREDGGNRYVRFERLDATLATEGLRLESLVPGGYRVAVELGGGSWTEQPVLAREELALAAGETRELVLALADPPASPARATLGGVVSFPAPTASWGAEHARLQLYFQPTQRWRDPDVELSLADLKRVGGALPTWAFRVEDLPVGPYRVQLLPFLKVWMIDLPAAGREDLELVLPELAEVLVETVAARTGERVPLDELYYRSQEPHPRQLQNDFARAATEEPGRFRFWTAPGAVMVWPRYPTGPDRDPGSGKVLDLMPGSQSLRFELEPVYAMRFEFREGGSALPVGDPGMSVMQNVRAVGHEGRVTRDGLQRNMRVEVSAPGVYEIRFDGLDADRYHPLPPRLVDVRAGETTEVIVELRRR